MGGSVTGAGRESPVSYGSTSPSSSTGSKSPLLNRAAQLFVSDAKNFAKENEALLVGAALGVVIAGAILGFAFGVGHVHANMDALKWSGVGIGGATGLGLLARFGYSMYEVKNEDEADREVEYISSDMSGESAYGADETRTPNRTPTPPSSVYNPQEL